MFQAKFSNLIFHITWLCILIAISMAISTAAGAQSPSVSGAQGAAGRFWSFQPLHRVAPPTGKGDAWARTPIDRFILARLAAKGLQPNPQADRRVLIRRATFDLIGLPPTPQEVEAFVKDTSPDAYTALIDRLLASPHYGERWARHWLDLARYADSDGYEPDQDRLTAYPYRDFVIHALNSDMPYDRFVRLQLAGDEEAPGDPEAWAATGFCTAGIHSIFTNANEGTPQEREKMRYDEWDDMLTTTCSTFLGLTVGCARCHDHKFDPIPTRDYYRMLAAFTTTTREERYLATPAEIARYRQQLAEGKHPAEPPKALGLTDSRSTPETSWLLARGDPEHKTEQVQFGLLTVLSTSDRPSIPPPPGAQTTYQRTTLARWLTDVEGGAGALIARVIVNRLWQHHFGEGLVRTPGDFGKMGERPTHSELLDWLAAELIRNGWHLKPIQRLILTSAVYRQSIAYDATRAAVDPENRLFWHRRPLRLEAEALRDSILAVSGHLDTSLYGPPVKPALPAEAMAGRNKDDKVARPVEDGPAQWRRSIYLWVKRSLTTPMLETFDAPNANATCPRRTVSTVATQALALLNDRWVRNQARLFAQRVQAESDGTPAHAIEHAYLLALGRPPTPQELSVATPFLARQDSRQGLVNLCHVLLTLNEFIYID